MKLLAHCRAPLFKGALQTKIMLVMKLTAVFLLVGALSVSANTFSQKVSLTAKDMPLSKVFSKLEKQTGFTFIYDHDLIEHARPVTINAKDVQLATLLNTCLKDQGLIYDVKYDIIVVKKEIKPTPSLPNPPPADSIYRFHGRITNENNEPLAGVSINIKGASVGATTDARGEFEIKTTTAPSATLVISYVGYEQQEVRAITGRNLDIKMKAANKALDNFVVVGYGSQKQKDLTGAVSTVGSKDFNQGALLSPQQAVQGKITGVNISQNSGKPGGSNTIRIRGGTSLTQSNDPLYVIDGVPISNTPGVGQANIGTTGTNVFDMEPTNPLMTLSPDDIESITVLKDASAAAIYGSRGANGVIVITTKKGSGSKARISLGMSAGASNVEGTLKVLSADQYRQTAQKYGLTIDDKGGNTDWQKLIYRTGYSQDYNLALSGGGDKTSYRASLAYGDNQGIMLASDLKRTNARININHSELDGRLTFDLRLNYGQTFTTQSPISNTVGSENGTSMNYEALVFNPTYPVRDPSGDYYFIPPYRVNPVSFSDQVFDQVTNNRFIGNLTTTLKIVDPLSVNVSLGYTDQNINRNSYIDKANLLGAGLGGYASVQKLEDYSKLLETYLRFNKRYGAHSIDAIGGYSWQYFLSNGDRTTAQGFLSDEFKWYSLQAASTISSISTFQQSNKLISFYGRVNYAYDDRILITGTVRRDGSSRFGSGHKWGVFPSGSVAWRISQEKFLQQVKPITDLKVRLSYGVTGNQEIGNLNSITTLGASTTGYIVGGNRITTVLPQQYANPNLKWEQTSQLDGGIDYTLFEGRLRGTLDYYVKKTTDLLLRIPVPQPSAISTQLANVGSVQNKGIEVAITGRILDKHDFTWESSFNISFNKNKVLSLSNEQYSGKNIQIAPLQGTVSLGKYAQLIVPGQPLGTFWGPRFTGIKDSIETFAAGNDTIIGCAQPKYIFGFTNTFAYKRWSLNITFRGTVGNDVFNLTAANLSYMSNLPGRNMLLSGLKSGVRRDQAKNYSSRWIENGSFVRLDNLTLGYDIKLPHTFINNARVYLTGQNLLLIKKYSGVDPEVNSEISGTGTAPLGVDYLSYPRARTVLIGANFTF